MPKSNIARNRSHDLATPNHLVASMEALGLVMAYLARHEPFSRFRVSSLVEAIQYQLTTRNHLCLIERERIVGYCGWLPTDERTGAAWMQGEAKLAPVIGIDADAVALTVFACDESRHTLPMIRQARTLNKGKRVFFRRDREGRPSKRATVLNV